MSLELNTWDDLAQVLKVREKVSSCIHVLHKTTHKGISRRRSCSWVAKECTRKWAACAGLLLCLLNVMFLEVRWSLLKLVIASVVAKFQYALFLSSVV